LTNAASDPVSFCLLAFVVSAAVEDAAVPVAAAPPLVACSAADDKPLADSAVSPVLPPVAKALQDAGSAEAGWAASGDLPAVVRPDDHFALAVDMGDLVPTVDSVLADSIPDGCSVVRRLGDRSVLAAQMAD